MITSLTSALAIAAAYFGSAALLILEMRNAHHTKRPLVIAWLAIVTHLYSLSVPFWQAHNFNFSFFNIASLIAGLVSLLLLLACIRKPVGILGIILFPITATLLLLNHWLPQATQTVQSYSPSMHLHILSSIIAFSLLTISALQALLLAIHEQQLRKHPPKRFIMSLPPLQTMESLLFQMICTGMAFLSVSLISGFLFIEDLFAQHLAHKTILSMLAWIIFSGLLFGRIRYGWRGKTAVKWTLAGFILLLLAYFGSKLVLEIILHR